MLVAIKVIFRVEKSSAKEDMREQSIKKIIMIIVIKKEKLTFLL